MEPLRPIEIPSVHQELQERIKEYIAANRLKPGDALPTEAQLADQMRLSRTVIREALRSLESLGVIYSRRGEGRFVSSFSLDPIVQNLGYSMLSDLEDVREVLEVRERLEIAFLEPVVDAVDDETLAELRELVRRIEEKIARGEEFAEEDRAFHRVLFSPVDNRLLVKLLEIFWDVFRKLRDVTVHVASDPMQEVVNHARIVDAIEARDVALARSRMRDHFRNIEDRLRAALAERRAAVR